jgi:hypothetical protein
LMNVLRISQKPIYYIFKANYLDTSGSKGLLTKYSQITSESEDENLKSSILVI